jgi:hypothetical protein
MRKYVAHAMAVVAFAGAFSAAAAAPAAANDAAAYLQDAAQCHIWLLSGDANYVPNCTPSHVAVSFKSLSEPGTVGGPMPRKKHHECYSLTSS